MNLVIDIGNTQTKAAVFSNEKLVALKFFSQKTIVPELKAFCKRQKKISLAILCSVTNNSKEINKFLNQNFNFYELNEGTNLPLKNIYNTPKTLGKDRLANAIAANFIFPKKNILVIDAGTCIKYDFVNSKNEYLGGAISPGIEMRFKALNNFTGKLPLIKKSAKIVLTGKTTEESILSGVQNGVLAEISGVVRQYKKKYGNFKVILTGGDAAFINSFFSEKNRIFAAPNLTLVGLNVILNYNAA